MPTMIDLDTKLKWMGNTLFLGKIPLAKIPERVPQNHIAEAKEDCESSIRQQITES